MSDALQAALWLLVLGGGLGFCVAVKRTGLATTHVRDLLHVGASAWVFGWPFFHGAAVPIGIAAAAAAGVAAVPALAPRVPALARLRDAVSGGDEGWDGLVLYTAAFAALTALGALDAARPAAAAALALAWGDGVGGFVGRRFGRVRYRVPWAKPKSLEGSLAVWLAATAGAACAGALFGPSGLSGPPGPLGPALPLAWAAAAGLAAAAAEALAPRASDNALVPAAVWLLLHLGPG